MKVEIKVPNFGESISEATVVGILKPPGSQVKKDEEILELETEKVNQVIHSPADGIISLTVNLEDTVTIGQVIGEIDSEGKASEAPPPKAEEPKKEEPKQEDAAPPPPATPTDGPSARRTPEEFLSSKPQEAPQVSAAPVPREEGQKRQRMSGLRKTIAKRLVQVKNETAMLTTFNELDMTAIMAIRSKEKDNFFKKHGVKLGFMSFFINACVAALKAFPSINAFIDGDEIVYNDGFHMGVAVSTEKGLFVPVIRNCEDLSYAEIESKLIEYATQAKEGKIAIDSLKGGTFTLTNGGVFGSLLSTPILNPPQSGILGMHSIVKRPVAIGDQVVIRPMMYLALSYDHRIVDGKEAVQFLVHIKNNLEDPARLLLDF